MPSLVALWSCFEQFVSLIFNSSQEQKYMIDEIQLVLLKKAVTATQPRRTVPWQKSEIVSRNKSWLFVNTRDNTNKQPFWMKLIKDIFYTYKLLKINVVVGGCTTVTRTPALYYSYKCKQTWHFSARYLKIITSTISNLTSWM